MKALLVLVGMVFGAGISSAQPTEAAWSPVVTGLRGHLAIEATHDPDPTEPTYMVLLVLENVGVIGNLGKISNTAIMDFVTFDLKMEVKDEKGTLLPDNTQMGGNRMSETYRLTLPADAVLSFPVARGGDAPPHYVASGNPQGKFLQKDEDFACWVVPPSAAGKYFISGTLNCLRPLHPALEQLRRETPHAWHGTLILPPVQLPQN